MSILDIVREIDTRLDVDREINVAGDVILTRVSHRIAIGDDYDLDEWGYSYTVSVHDGWSWETIDQGGGTRIDEARSIIATWYAELAS